MKSWREQTGRKNDRVKENVQKGSMYEGKGKIEKDRLLLPPSSFPNYNFSNEKLEIFQVEE